MNFPRFFLISGLVGGIVLTAVGLLRNDGTSIPKDAVAVVNGHAISSDLYERVLDGVETDRDLKTLPPEDARHVLDRMIDEELLVQEAVAVGMASRDRLARGYLVQAMIDFVSKRQTGDAADDETLQSFYDENRQLFSRPGKIALRVMSFDVFQGQPEEPVLEKARAARQELQNGAAWEVVEKKLADAPVLTVPQAPLSAKNVLEYLGPTATRAAFQQAKNSIGEPIRVATGYMLIQVVERWDDTIPPFESIREDVRDAFERQQSEEALREYLADLRARADIRIHER